MGVKIIPVTKLTIGTIVTDPDILRDLKEPDAIRVIALKEAPDAAITVTFQGLHRIHKDTFGNLFGLEVQVP